MAYTKELQHSCQVSSCGKRAVIEVFNFRNASLGEFCRRHGTQTLNVQRAREVALMSEEATA